MPSLTIGEVARRADLGVETVRFYERQGLLEEPERRASGYRQYDEEAVTVLRFIRRAKGLGFTLKEIKSLLGLRLDASAKRADVRRQAKEKVADIEAKIADLQRMREALLSLVNQCRGDGAATGCPILRAMQGEDATHPRESER